MEITNQKPFEQPNAGMFLGTIIDVIDLPNVQTAFGPKNKVRLVWVLGQVNNQPALDSEGKPYRIIDQFNASISPKAKLYERIQQVLNAPPPLITTSEQLSELLINRSGQLYLVNTPNPTNPQKPYINIAGVMPLAPGQVAPQAPAGFVRAKDKAQQAAQQAQRPAYAAPAPAYAPAPAPAYSGAYQPPQPPPAQQPGQPAAVPAGTVRF